MSVQEPMDLVKNALGMRVFIKCRNNRNLTGRLHAYDEHLNLMLSKVEETFVETSSKGVKKDVIRNIAVLYMRGDTIIGISPLKAANDKLEEEKLITIM